MHKLNNFGNISNNFGSISPSLSLLLIQKCPKWDCGEMLLKNSKFWILFQISHLLSRVEQSIMQQEAKLKVAYKESTQQLHLLDTKWVSCHGPQETVPFLVPQSVVVFHINTSILFSLFSKTMLPALSHLLALKFEDLPWYGVKNAVIIIKFLWSS